MWGEGRQLGHEKEAVCIVSGWGVYVRRSTLVASRRIRWYGLRVGCVYGEIDAGWDTRKRLYVL